MWSGVAITLLFVVARLYTRWRLFRRFRVDDYLVILAWIIFLVQAIWEQTHLEIGYLLVGLQDGSITTLPSDFLNRVEEYTIGGFITFVLFTSSLYCIKLSFLLLFRRLGENITGQWILWWTVTVITGIFYILMFATYDYSCVFAPISELLGNVLTYN